MCVNVAMSPTRMKSENPASPDGSVIVPVVPFLRAVAATSFRLALISFGAFSVSPSTSLDEKVMNNGSVIASPIIVCGASPLFGDVYGAYTAADEPDISESSVSPSVMPSAGVSNGPRPTS